MNYCCTVEFPFHKDLMKALEMEQRGGGRASWKLSASKVVIRFTTVAEDAVALRAQLSSFAKLLSVWESATKAIENGSTKGRSREN
jgi:tRNA threonylcarbamoyladenosine modification (KEOPS) complex  Pcc1 subunit